MKKIQKFIVSFCPHFFLEFFWVLISVQLLYIRLKQWLLLPFFDPELIIIVHILRYPLFFMYTFLPVFLPLIVVNSCLLLSLLSTIGVPSPVFFFLPPSQLFFPPLNCSSPLFF